MGKRKRKSTIAPTMTEWRQYQGNRGIIWERYGRDLPYDGGSAIATIRQMHAGPCAGLWLVIVWIDQLVVLHNAYESFTTAKRVASRALRYHGWVKPRTVMRYVKGRLVCEQLPK